jgi:putative ABC transport system ATP-binding protein
MTDIVRLEKVTKEYRLGDITVPALRGVDLTIEPKSFSALAGPSGSGKSTLLNLVSGLDRPTQGRVFVAGTETTSLGATELSRLRLWKIGFIFQSYNLLPVLTAFENAEYILMMQGRPPKERRERVMELLKRVGLEGMEHRFPRELSGGQQQRVAIARAIAAEPALVLADEPTANLDSSTASALLDLMVQLNEERGITFVFSTHDPSVMKRAKKTMHIRDGVMVPNPHDPNNLGEAA